MREHFQGSWLELFLLAAAMMPGSSLMRGEILDERFAIEQLAGSGGMGEVYQATDRLSGQRVAVKVLLGERNGDMTRFERETRLLSSIQHPRVVEYVTHGVLPSGDPYLVMEWLEGNDLSARLARGPLTLMEATTLGIGAAEGLTALHEQGIVHRDVKPSNIYLVNGEFDCVKLVDFGIARSGTASKLTGTGMLLGTAAYMAPEQANAAASIGPPADIFSLGCVLFECLTGEKAFDGANVMAILTKILFKETPSLSEKRPDLPKPVCNLVDRMLSKAPEDRPANGHEVAHTLRNLESIHELQTARTAQLIPMTSLTHSEQRAVALIFIGASQSGNNDGALALEAAKHGGRFERLLDGSAAVMFSGTQIPTDLAMHAARCALALKRIAHDRPMTLTMGRSDAAERIQIGIAIDRAASLASQTQSDGMLEQHVTLDDSTAGLLNPRFDVLEDSGVFVLRAERAIAEIRTLLGKATPCVGRDRELRQVEDAFDECVEDSRARVMLFTGPAGMGKTRIGREIVQRLRARDSVPSIWSARGESTAAGSALSMLAELIRGTCDSRSGELLDVRRNKLRIRVEQHVPVADQRRVTAFLGEIIGAQFSDEGDVALGSARQDARLMSDQIRAAFVDFLRAECAAGPVFLLLEDLHWGDGSTVRILDAALAALVDKPLFLLGLARPEVDELFPRLWAERGIETKRLQQLSKKASEQLVKHVLGGRVESQMIERIVQLADGNAFYLEELIRAASTGMRSDLPQTVVAMVQSRLGALAEEQRRMLRAASIFGQTFWTGAVAALLGANFNDSKDTEQILRALVDAELVQRSNECRFHGQDEYIFRHALMREGAHAMLTQDDATLGHRLAGQWLEDHGEVDALVLAGHFRKGNEGERAATFYLRAAETASTSGDTDAVIAYAKQGLDCAPTDHVRLSLLGMLCESIAWKYDRSLLSSVHIDEILARAPRGSKPWVQAVVGSSLIPFDQGNTSALAALHGNLLHATPFDNAAGLFVFVTGVAALQLDMMGDTAMGAKLMQRCHDAAMTSADVQLHAQYQSRKAMRIVASGTGNPWKARENAIAARKIFQTIGSRRMDAMTSITEGLSAWCLGQFEMARHVLEHPPLPENELAYARFMRAFALCWLQAEDGELELARSNAETYIGIGRNIPHHHDARHRWLLAEALRRQGDWERAQSEVAIAIANTIYRIDFPGMYATLAAIHLGKGEHEEALQAAETGMMHYERMNACGFSRTAYLRQVHAECLYALGRTDDAKTAILAAKAWLHEIAAEIEDETFRQSYLTVVPENKKILHLAEQWLH